MNSLIESLFLIGMHGRIGSDVYRSLAFLRKTETWDRKQLDHLQSQKFASLYQNAHIHTKFYGSSTYTNFGFNQSEELRDFIGQLPILTKEIVRATGPNLKRADIAKVFESRTGGTTGTPLEISKCSAGVAWALGALWRGRAVGGIHPTSPGVFIKGFQVPSWRGWVKMRLLRKHIIQAFGADSRRKNQLSSILRRGKIKFLEGYVSDLISHATAFHGSCIELNAVFTTGEMLYSQQREQLRKAFNAPVYSYYGSNEIGGIAFECEHGELHITDEHVLVEVLDEKGVSVWDKLGRIVVTDLDNQAMPLIRYELGDLGTITRTPCKCGRNHTRLSSLSGRLQEYLENTEGQRLPIAFFEGRFRNLRSIGRVQLLQTSLSEVSVLYDGQGEDAESEAEWLRREIEAELGGDVQVILKETNEFFTTVRGKVPLIRRLL